MEFTATAQFVATWSEYPVQYKVRVQVKYLHSYDGKKTKIGCQKIPKDTSMTDGNWIFKFWREHSIYTLTLAFTVSCRTPPIIICKYAHIKRKSRAVMVFDS